MQIDVSAIETIIGGLECCEGLNGHPNIDCEVCPYYHEKFCYETNRKDAATALRELLPLVRVATGFKA